MSPWLDWIRSWLLPLLYVLAAVFATALIALVVSRALQVLLIARRGRLVEQYRAMVDAFLQPQSEPEAAARLATSPPEHQLLIGDLLIAAVRPARGQVVLRLREAAHALGLLPRWRLALRDRRWWIRADAARALGLFQEPTAVDALIALLDDPHEEVRAAAVDALGRIGDGRAVPALLSRFPDESRHQRTRVFEALRRLGPSVPSALLTYVNTHPEHTKLVIEVLGSTGAATAIDRLLEWTADPDADIRAAAMRAVGSIGLDDRSVYFALRGLDDPDAGVRAMAARALGRSRRAMAAPYLASRLADDWLVAAHAATGLRHLGSAGKAQLEPIAAAPGQAGVLARQMLWELKRGATQP